MRITVTLATIMALVAAPLFASAQDEAPPYECDDQFGQCGTPEQSGGGGCGCGGGSILVNNTDLGDTYQHADDYDDDGIEDPFDNCPFVRDFDQIDTDGDMIGDACDSCPGVMNMNQMDLDGDGIGDLCDDDADGDDISDAVDICPARADPLQVDTDNDGIGDACDSDDDQDGIADLEDNCPLVHNPDQVMPTGLGDCYADQDGDDIYDHRDNCPTIPNTDQANTDIEEELASDGILYGDACDPDMDADGIVNAVDNCQLVWNPSQIDGDRDGLGDGTDGSCDPAFCYVVMGDRENCLDPEGSFTVFTPSLTEIHTGEEIRLRLFSNREGGAPVEYRWSVEEAPGGSASTVRNPYGSVNFATPFEYRYNSDNVATFVPDEPGRYIIRVTATQVWEDQYSGELGDTDYHETLLVVTGESLAVGGCSVAGTGTQTSSAFALLALIGLFIGRRFRH